VQPRFDAFEYFFLSVTDGETNFRAHGPRWGNPYERRSKEEDARDGQRRLRRPSVLRDAARRGSVNPIRLLQSRTSEPGHFAILVMNRFVLVLLLLGATVLLVAAERDAVPSSLEEAPMNRDEGRGQSCCWKPLGNDVWIPLSNLTATNDDDGRHDASSVAPPSSAAASSSSSSSISLSRTNRRLVVLSEGVAQVYDLRDDADGANRYHWYPIRQGPGLQPEGNQGNGIPADPTETSATGEGTVVVAATAISPNGLLLARHVVVAVEDSSTANPYSREDDDDDDGTKIGRSKSRRSGDRDPEPDQQLLETYNSTIQVISIADDVVLGSWTESYTSTSESSLVCLSDTRLAMEDRFLLVMCPSWNGHRGRALLYQVLPVPQLVWEVRGENEGDALGRAGDLDAASREGVVRVALASPGYVQETGLVRVYDLVSQGRRRGSSDTSWTATQVGRDLMGVTPGDGFGISVSLSHTGDGTAVIASKKGVVYVVSFQRSPQNSGSNPSSFASIVQEIEIPINDGSGNGRDPSSDLGSAPFSDVSVYLTPDAQRLVVASETIGNVVVETTKQVIVYETAMDAAGINSWTEAASFRLNVDQLVTTTGYALADWSVDRTRNVSDRGSRWGRARVLLDRTAFCSADFSCHSDPFLERRNCRIRLDVAADRDSCQSSEEFGNATCQWAIDEATTGGSTNTIAPTSSPPESTSNPSFAPAAILTDDPDIMTPLAACLCDRDLTCTSEPAVPDRDLWICVLGMPSRLRLNRVTSFYFQQDRIRYSVLGNDGSSIEGFSSRCTDAVCLVVVPHWKSDLLTKGESNLLAAGTVALAALSPSRLRKTRASFLERSRLPAGGVNPTQGYFSAVILLSKAPCEQKAERVQVSYAFWIVLSFLLFVALLCCTCTLNKSYCHSGEEGELTHISNTGALRSA
jgi:hypothetical protein